MATATKEGEMNKIGTWEFWRSPLRVTGFGVLYTVTLILILSAIRAAEQGNHKFQINFEYRVF